VHFTINQVIDLQRWRWSSPVQSLLIDSFLQRRP